MGPGAEGGIALVGKEEIGVRSSVQDPTPAAPLLLSSWFCLNACRHSKTSAITLLISYFLLLLFAKQTLSIVYNVQNLIERIDL